MKNINNALITANLTVTTLQKKNINNVLKNTNLTVHRVVFIQLLLQEI